MAEGTPFKLTDCTIISLAKNEGVNENTGKAWLLFKFKVDHPKAQGKEFAKFDNISKPENWPYEGAKIASMEGIVKKSGQYTNYEVNKILYDQTPKPPPAEEDPFAEAPSKAQPESFPTERGIGKECSVCTSYAMELMKGLLMQGLSPNDANEALPIICDSVGRNGYILYATLKASMEKERELK